MLGALELTAIPSLEEQHWLPTLETSDAILVAGGNNGYLSYWFHESELAGRLPTLLDHAVYVGISAGSILLTPGFNYDPERLSQTGIYYDTSTTKPPRRELVTTAASSWSISISGRTCSPRTSPT